MRVYSSHPCYAIEEGEAGREKTGMILLNPSQSITRQFLGAADGRTRAKGGP